MIIFQPHDVPEKWAKNTGKSRDFSAEKEPKKKNKEEGKKRKTNKIEKVSFKKLVFMVLQFYFLYENKIIFKMYFSLIRYILIA